MKTCILSVACFFYSLVSWGQNNAPTIVSSQPNTGICTNQQDQTIYSNIVLNDPDGDNLTIVSYNAVNTNTIFAIQAINVTNTPGSISFEFFGNGSDIGDADIDFAISDNIDTFFFSLTLAKVVAGPTITINPNATFCANSGAVNLNQFVHPTGGEFQYDGIHYPGGHFNPIAAGYNQNITTYFEYTYSDGTCITTENFQLGLIFSPTVTIQTSSTTCGGATGSAQATISETGNTAYQSWSNGAINTASVSNLSAGSYIYNHTDTSNCVTTKVFTISPANVNLNPTVTHVNCFGQSTGSISIAPNGLTAPVNYVWSTGKTNVTTISGLKAGTYSVYATDTNNCHVVEHITVTENPKIEFQTSTYLPSCGQTNGSATVWLISGGTPGGDYTVQWNTGLMDDTLSNIGFGIYSVNVTDTAGCMATKTVYISEQNAVDITGTVYPAQCGSPNGKILVDLNAPTDPVGSILWSNGDTTEDMLNIPNGNYVCTVTTQNSGCKSVKGWDLPIVAPLVQELCIITVDSATTTNLLVWDKAQPIGIDYYNIYRETSNQGEFILIDTVSASSLSMFNDVVASPMERSWSYKISAVNFCGVESPLSNLHKTINLKIIDLGNATVQVSWNAYQGATFDSYKLFRYTNANGWELAATVSSNMLSYVDNIDFNTAGLDYMVEFELEEACTAEKAQDFNTTRSNRERGQMTTGVGVDGASNNSIAINYLNSIQAYPNPTTDKLTFVQTGYEKVDYTIHSISGQVVSHVSSNEQTVIVDMNNLDSGVYLVEMKIGDAKAIKRIVKL